MGRPTPAHRSPARTSTHPEEDDVHTNTTRSLPSTGVHTANATPWLESAPSLPQPCHAHRRCTPEPPRSGHRHPISCSVSRVSSPQTAFNPHTPTALAPYCKSPYPHCSAFTAPELEKFSLRSTADTALEICTKPASRVAGSGVRFGRTNCMLHPAAAIAAVTNPVPESARNCCTAMNLLKAIVLPNPHTV